MCHLRPQPSVTFLLPNIMVFAGLVTMACTASGDEPGTRANIADVRSEHAREVDFNAHFALDDREDPNYWLAQTQPPAVTPPTESRPVEAAPRPAPALLRSEALAARRRRSTYRLPSMFGDFYGGSSLQATIQFPSQLIQQTFIDNFNADFFVTNRNGGQGADPNPAVGIDVRDQSNSMLVTSSNGAGVPAGGSVEYPINEPQGAAFQPQQPGPGTLVYNGGVAFYAGGPPGPEGNGEGWGIDYSHLFTPDPVQVNVPSGGGAVRRVKIAENNSPLPRDRFIFNYNFFNDVFSGIGDVNRYAVGFEHTMFGENSSIEVLFPMASTLDVDQIAGGMRSTDTEFGDLTLIYKHLLMESEDFLISGGLGLTVPTGDDAGVFNTTGQQIIDIEHASTHLLPFLAMLHSYDSGFYWQAFFQLDIDLNGNPLSADVSAANLQPVGVLQDQTLLFADVGGGYWLTNPNNGTPAVALTAEVHWASTLQDADTVNANGLNITSVLNRYDVVNLTLGANVLVNDSFSVRPAMVIPLSDAQFDYEAMVQMNFWR